MLVGIHQLHYLPWLRYLEKIHRADSFIVLDDIQYSKNGWQNRNKIKSASGPTVLSVPILNRHQQSLDEVCIPSDSRWSRKHWKSIEQAYGRAPYFDEYAPFLQDTYSREWGTLNALNRHMLEFYVDALGISTTIAYSSELAVPGMATERLINLIKAVGGDTYYSGAYALEAYLDASLLEKSGINLMLQNWHSTVYSQLHGEFVPDLSIIDLLMNCGAESLSVLSGETNSAV